MLYTMPRVRLSSLIMISNNEESLRVTFAAARPTSAAPRSKREGAGRRHVCMGSGVKCVVCRCGKVHTGQVIECRDDSAWFITAMFVERIWFCPHEIQAVMPRHHGAAEEVGAARCPVGGGFFRPPTVAVRQDVLRGSAASRR